MTPRARGPRGGGADTRADILRAAVDLFSLHGFEATSMRAIAREARVDPSLPRHYFPSKSQLFVEALGPVKAIESRTHEVSEGPPEELGERIVRTFLSMWDSPEDGPRLRLLLTNAVSTPEIAEVFKQVLIQTLSVRVAQGTGSNDATGRAATIASQMMGLALARYVIRLEPLASAPSEEIVSRLGPAIQRIVMPLGPIA